MRFSSNMGSQPTAVASDPYPSDLPLRATQSKIENTSAAESRIRDVDVASETAVLTKNQVLQQAGISILSQANVSTSIALALLQ